MERAGVVGVSVFLAASLVHALTLWQWPLYVALAGGTVAVITARLSTRENATRSPQPGKAPHHE